MTSFYDETLGKSQTLRYLNRMRDTIRDLLPKTHFNKDELEKILVIHYKISLKTGSFNVDAFRQFCHTVLGITDDMHNERIYEIFDPKFTSKISPESWAINLSIMLRGKLPEQIKFVWKVYSYNKFITRESMTVKLKKAIIKKKGDTGYDSMLKELVMLLMKQLDKDTDGRVSYDDFRTAVEKNVLLLECLGQCLPTPQATSAFLTTITGKLHRQVILPQLPYHLPHLQMPARDSTKSLV